MENILTLLHLTHYMKRIERFRNMPFWQNTNIKRWDSNAEHSYRMAIMAILLIPYLKKKYNIEKLLKMILLHDLVEIIINDKFPFKNKNGKFSLPKNYSPDNPKEEINAFKILLQELPKSEIEEFSELLYEFIQVEIGKKSSNEAQLAVALDRIEASLQVSDYIKLNEFNISDQHSKLQIAYLKSKSEINEPHLDKLVNLIEKELAINSKNETL